MITRIDLSRSACDERLFLALMHITVNDRVWDPDDWLRHESGLFDDDDLLRSTVDRLNDEIQLGVSHPCGTVGSLAGHAVMAAQLAWATRWAGEVKFSIKEDAEYRLGVRLSTKPCFNSAATLFGLNEADATVLFDWDNTLEDLWDCAKEFTNGRVKLPKALKSRVKRIDKERRRSRCRLSDHD